MDIRRDQRLGFQRSHGRRRIGRYCGRLGCGSTVAQSAAQAVDGYAGLGALVRHQSEICQVAFSERPVLVNGGRSGRRNRRHIADTQLAAFNAGFGGGSLNGPAAAVSLLQ